MNEWSESEWRNADEQCKTNPLILILFLWLDSSSAMKAINSALWLTKKGTAFKPKVLIKSIEYIKFFHT